MIISKNVEIYYLLEVCVIVLGDRITKLLALTMGNKPIVVTDMITFELAFNRGISWGMFHSSSMITFWVLTLLISAIIIGLLGHTVMKWIHKEQIYGEIAVLSGAISNVIDRCVYGSVIDFVHISYGSWSWPIFNIADVAIVLGVGWILWSQKST